MTNTAFTTATPDWCKIMGEYFPPANDLVWTTDGNAVRKGVWTSRDPSEWKQTDPPSFDPGIWRDEHGAPIVVTHWLGLEASPDLPPPMPQI